MNSPRHSLTCTGSAWLFGWVTAVFLPGAIMAVLTAAETGFDFRQCLRQTWEIADNVGPFAKLMMGGLLGLGFFVSGRFKLPILIDATLNIATGVAAVCLTLAFLPQAWSRGFGIGLTGLRFDPSVWPIYLVSAAAAGVVFTLSVRMCSARSKGKQNVFSY